LSANEILENNMVMCTSSRCDYLWGCVVIAGQTDRQTDSHTDRHNHRCLLLIKLVIIL
jgi:hypothetical protein